MAISQNFPTIQPTLNLNFARSKRLDPRITFTRSSSATRTNAQGLIEIVSANVPRFDHSINPTTGTVTSLGLLIEESRTNYFNYSIPSISDWSAINLTNSTVSFTAPDGSSTVSLLSATSINGQSRIESGGQRTPGATYTQSCFCKAGTINYITFGLYDATSGTAINRQAVFYLVGSGSVTSSTNNISTSITQYQNGWYRCSMTTTISSGASYSGSSWKIGVCNDPSAYYNANIGDSVYVWGAQVEAGAFPTSYIPTSGSQSTRSSDNASITGTNFSSWYNQSEGTLVATAKSSNLTASRFPDIAVINDGTNSNRHIFAYITTSLGGAIIDTGGVRQVEIYPSVSTNPRKGSFSYKSNDFATSWNGQTVSTDTSVSIPIVNRMQIGDMPTDLNTIYNLNGTISQLTYYPRRLSNSQLQSLTR